MLDKNRNDRDYLWGRIFGELSLWMDRAKLTSAQYETYIHDWSAHPASTFAVWMECYQMTVIESGAARGDEDKRIGEIMWHITADMMTDDPLGPDCFVAYYQERGEHRTMLSQVMSQIGQARSPRKAAASRANGAKGGRPRSWDSGS